MTIRPSRRALDTAVASALSAVFAFAVLPANEVSAAPDASEAASVPSPSNAAQAARLPLTPQATLAGNDPFAPVTVIFNPDRKTCEARFGKDALARCRATFARSGTPARGVKLTPAHPGAWRWAGPAALVFTPEKPWPAGKRFTVSTQSVSAPIGWQIVRNTSTFQTAPLAVRNAELSFWMDSTAEGERVLTFEANFTSPPDRASFEAGFSIKPETADPAEKPVVAKPAFIWSEDGLSVYVRMKVEALGRAGTALTAMVPGIADRVVFDAEKGAWFIPKGREAVRRSAVLPGRETLMRAELEGARPAVNDALESRYDITLHTSLRVAPEDVARAVEVRLLPLRMDESAPRSTEWSGAARIDEASWAKSKPLKFEVLGAPVAGVRHTLRIAGEPGRFVAVKVPKGFGTGGYELGADYTAAALLPEVRPNVALLHPGNLITRSGAGRVSIAASSVDLVRWRLERVNDAFNVLAMDGYDTLQNPVDLSDRSEIAAQGEIPVSKSPDAAFAAIDLSAVRNEKGAGLYTLVLEGLVREKTDKSDAAEGAPDERLVTAASETRRLLVSDLAVLAKTNADESLTVFVSDLVRETPVEDAEVAVLGANGVELASVRSDEAGRAQFQSLKGLEREKRPMAVVVRTKNDAQWLSLADPAAAAHNMNAALAFGGKRTGADDGAAAGLALAASAFTERGVYRPGETIRWSALVRDADGKTVPQNLPLRLEVVSYESGTVLKENLTAGAGLLTRDVKLPENLSGRVRLDLISGRWNVLASTTVAVEAFEAETMQLSAPAPQPGWRPAEDAAVEVEARHLAGAAAAGLQITGRAVITPYAGGELPGHPGFTAALPSSALPDVRTETLVPVATDEAGRARVALDPALLSQGFSHVRFDLEAVDPEGGRTATKSQTLFIGAPKALCGWRLTDNAADPSFLSAGDPAQAEVLVLGPDLKPLAGRTLTIRTARAERVPELTEGPGGRLTYVETPVRAEESERTVTTDERGLARFELATTLPGEGILEVLDEEKNVLLETTWRVAGSDLRTARSPQLPSAEMRLGAKSTALHAGGPLELSVVSPFEGYGLVTLEDRRVRWSEWIRVKPGENTLSMTLPKDNLTPGRGFLHVSLIRAGSLPEGAAPKEEVERRRANAARLRAGYAEAIVPVTVDVEARRLDIELTPEEKNGQLTVTVRSERPAQAVIHAVDEGILSLTGHPVPDPLNAIYLDRALEVTTLEALTKQMPEGLALPKPLLWGGDMERTAAGAPAQNPFARTAGPAAVWTSGPVAVGPEGKTFNVTLPEGWHGRVRLVAAAAETDGPAVGAANASARICAPLMLDPIVPLAVAPGDRFRAGATVLLEDAPSAPITAGWSVAGTRGSVEIGASGAAAFGRMLTAPSEPQALAVPMEAAATLNRRLATVSRTVVVPVRPAALPRREAEAGIRTDSARKNFSLPELERLSPAPDVQTQAVVSTLPVAWVRALVPQAAPICGPVPVETAAAEALGFFSVMPSGELRAQLPGDADEAARRKTRLLEAADRQSNRYGWNASKDRLDGLETDLTLMAALLAVPPELDPAPDALRRTADRLERAVRTTPESMSEARLQLTALWLLTREGTLVAQELNALAARLDESLPMWRKDPAVLLAGAAYARMRMTEEALPLLSSRIDTRNADLADTARAVSALADAERITGERFPASETLPGELTRIAADQLQRGGTDTLSAAWTAAALAASGAGTVLPESVSLVCRAYAPGFQAAPQLTRTEKTLTLKAPGCVAFAVENAPAEPLYWSTLSVGSPAVLPATPAAKGLAVTKRYLNDQGQPASTFRTGERVTVELKIEGAGRLLLADPIPGGFMHADQPGEAPDAGGTAAVAGFLRADDRFLVRLEPYDASAGPVTLRYTIRAVLPGTYAAGPAAVEDEADPTRRGADRAATLTVTDAVAK